MRRLRAGALRTPVYLGRPTIAQDASGGEVITWPEELKTWASFEPIAGREWPSATELKDSVDARISIRISDGWEPSARWRVRDLVTGDIYNIVAMLGTPKDKSAECLAKRTGAQTDGR